MIKGKKLKEIFPDGLTITAKFIYGDTLYIRQLGTQHLVAPIWKIFPHRNAGEKAFEAWTER